MRITGLLILLFGAYLRFSLPLIPLSDGDSWGYVSPAMTAEVNGKFELIYGRGIFYPAFLRFLFLVTNNIRSVTILQHSLGLLGAWILFCAWFRIGARLALRARFYFLYELLGLSFLSFYTTSSTQILLEQQVRPEGVFTFIGAFLLWCTIELILTPRENLKRRLKISQAVVFLNAILLFVKPQWGVGVVLCSLPAFFALPWNRAFVTKYLWQLILPGFLATFALSKVQSHYRENDPIARYFTPIVLFTFHAPLSLGEIDRELESQAPTPYPREFLEGVKKEFQAELFRSKSAVLDTPTLGYNGDTLLYGNSVAALIQTHLGGDPEKLKEFYWHYVKGFLRHQPIGYLEKIGQQLKAAYGVPSLLFREEPYSIGYHMGHTLESYSGDCRSLTDRSPLMSEYLKVAETLKGDQRYITVLPGMESVYRGLSYVFGPVVMLSFAVSIWLLLVGTTSESERISATLGVVLPSYNFANSFTVAALHTLDVPRYVQNQMIFTVFTLLFGVFILTRVANRVLDR